MIYSFSQLNTQNLKLRTQNSKLKTELSPLGPLNLKLTCQSIDIIGAQDYQTKRTYDLRKYIIIIVL
jgi:hypothetical protein